MRVAFDARVLDRPELAERGIGRYARSLLDAFDASGHHVVALRNLRRPPAPRRLAEFAEHMLLARDVRRAGAHVLHSPSIDFATLRPGLPYVVTVHDLLPLKHPERYLQTGMKHRLRYAAAKRAERVITPTRTVADDCERLLEVDADHIDVIHEAAAPVFRPVPGARERLTRAELPDRFLLWVGGLDPPDPRKGVAELVDAAARRGTALVLAGRESAEASELAQRGAVLTGRVTDEELAALYTAADALVFPSEEEGFGLPIIEALACGTPAAAFRIEALEELYSGSADVTLVEPGDFDGLLDAALSIAGSTATPPARTWADVADETWAVYETSWRQIS
jgi:glycosyltransferase involved in cell wall biosynthesis